MASTGISMLSWPLVLRLCRMSPPADAAELGCAVMTADFWVSSLPAVTSDRCPVSVCVTTWVSPGAAAGVRGQLVGGDRR